METYLQQMFIRTLTKLTDGDELTYNNNSE